MWRLLKQWYKENRTPIGVLSIASIGIGLLIAAICFFFPPLLVAFSTLTIFGLAPLAFLTTMQLPLSLLALASIMAGVAFGTIAASVLIVKQLTSISSHLYQLFMREEQPKKETIVKDTYNYFQAHLKINEYSESEEFDDKYNDLNTSSSSSDDKEVQNNSIASTAHTYFVRDENIVTFTHSF